MGVVESVGKLGHGLGLLPRDWYDRLELHLLRLRVTPPQRVSALSLKLTEPMHGLSDELGGAGKLWVRAELERTGAVHVFPAVPWDGKAGTVEFPRGCSADLPIHPLGDTLRLSAHCRSASSLMLRRELGCFALGASAREMGEKWPMEANVRLSGTEDEEVGRLALSARYVTRSRIGTSHAATRVAALVRGFLGRREVERILAYVVHLQCRWRAKVALRLMLQLRREKRASTHIQEWWLRGQRNNKKLLLSSMLQLDPFEATLLQLPIKVLHSTSWQPTPLLQLASTAAKSALPSALVPVSLDDAYLVLHDGGLRWGRLHRPQPLVVRAPLAARRSTLAALRRVATLSAALGRSTAASAGAHLPGRARTTPPVGVDVGVDAAEASALEVGAPPPTPARDGRTSRTSSSRASTIDGGLFDGGATGGVAGGSVRLPFKLVLLERRGETQRATARCWQGLARHEATDAAVPIHLSMIDAVRVVSYQSNEWQMAVRRKGDRATTTLRLQTRSAAALNAWMHVLQPVLRLDAASSGAAHATSAEEHYQAEFLKYHTGKDAALEIAQGRAQAAAPKPSPVSRRSSRRM